jgi:Domain of unknown function (DUF397)
MSLTELQVRDLQWRKAKRSAGNGECVEVALVNGQVAVRDSKNPGGARLQYPLDAWRSFVEIAKSDERCR